MVTRKNAAGTAVRTLDLLKAAGDENRLRILRLVERAELSVGELARISTLSQPSVSRHLATLRAVGLVDERHEGPKTLSRLRRELAEPAARLMEILRATYEARDFGHEDDVRELERLLARREAERAGRFDALAEDWDRLRRKLLGGALGAGEICGLLLPEGRRWVDVGTGTGLLLPWLSALAGPGGEVLAVEPAPRMLEAARRRQRELGLHNVRVVPGDTRHIPAADGWADGLVYSLSLGQAEDLPAALSEAARVLRPGGRLAVADLRRHPHRELIEALGAGFRGFEPAELSDALSAAGFDALRMLEAPLVEPSTGGEAASDLPRLEPLRLVATRAGAPSDPDA